MGARQKRLSGADSPAGTASHRFIATLGGVDALRGQALEDAQAERRHLDPVVQRERS